MEYIHRDIEPTLFKVIETFPAVAVTGPRQSGKSTLLLHSLPEYDYLTLDDPVTRDRAISVPRLLLSTLGERVIIDEIQWAPELAPYIKMEIDRRRDKNGAFVITGSQHFPLIRGLTESLAGRVAILELLPFSIREKRSFSPGSGGLAEFTQAALRGSYPELLVKPEMDPGAWFGSYIQTYLERDVRSLSNVGNLRDFQRFIQLLAARCAQVVNLSSLANDLAVSVSTIKNWLSILEASRIIYLLSPYYSNLGKRVTKAPKLYFHDIGLVCYLTGVRDSDHLIKGPMAGPLFENYCIQETLKRFANLGRRPNIFYLRTSNGLEVDLLIEQSFQNLIAVEIKLSRTPTPSMRSNLVRFKKVFKDFNIQRSFLVSLSDESFPMGDDVFSLPLDQMLDEID